MDAGARKSALRSIPYGMYISAAGDGKGYAGPAAVNWVTQGGVASASSRPMSRTARFFLPGTNGSPILDSVFAEVTAANAMTAPQGPAIPGMNEPGASVHRSG
jgi:hypothetical protein